MQVVVLGSMAQQAEWTSATGALPATVAWVFEKDMRALPPADAVIDLFFDGTPARTAFLQALPGLKIINSVALTLAQTDAAFVRINGWPTFLKAAALEAACGHEHLKKIAEAVFKTLGKNVIWVPDLPGFIAPRVVSLIINEAFFALEEGVSTESDIDTAMQLGTAYPYGPFTWGIKIGLKNINELLQQLALNDARYTPAPLLQQKATGENK